MVSIEPKTWTLTYTNLVVLMIAVTLMNWDLKSQELFLHLEP